MISKQILVLFTIISTAILGCNFHTMKNDYTLTKCEKIICDTMQMDTMVIKHIRKFNRNKIEPFHYSLSKIITKDSVIEADPIFLKGFVLIEKNTNSYNLVFSLKDKLKEMGYSIFLLENNFGLDNKQDNLGILKTTNKYKILKQIATDGINYDITNDSLISIIKRFDKKYSLELIGASGDWCEFIIHNEPENWTKFAKEVYEVCPDVVDQGVGNVQALANEMKQTKLLYFWWD